MSFPVEVNTKIREGSMSSQIFICEQSMQIICTCHTPSPFKICLSSFTKGNLCGDSVTDINPKFPRPCPGIVTSAFERYF